MVIAIRRDVQQVVEILFELFDARGNLVDADECVGPLGKTWQCVFLSFRFTLSTLLFGWLFFTSAVGLNLRILGEIVEAECDATCCCVMAFKLE